MTSWNARRRRRAEKKLAALGFSLAAVNQFIESGKPTVELQSILDNLAARGLRDFVKVDYHVIRGLAYYTGVVFEAFDAKGEFRAIAGGGRYDNLVKLISGGKVDLPALGFGMGDVVLLELLKARGLLPKFDATTDVFVLIEDEKLRPQSLKLVQDLRAAGYAVDYPLTPAKPDKQFKRAQELKVAHTARLENDDYVRIRNLKDPRGNRRRRGRRGESFGIGRGKIGAVRVTAGSGPRLQPRGLEIPAGLHHSGTVGRHYFCFTLLHERVVMIVEDNFFAEPKQYPSMVTVAELCERFATAGFPCRAERQGEEVWIVFEGRRSRLVFTLNASGRPLTASLPDDMDYDADFACAVFGVFDGIGWTFAPS